MPTRWRSIRGLRSARAHALGWSPTLHSVAANIPRFARGISPRKELAA